MKEENIPLSTSENLLKGKDRKFQGTADMKRKYAEIIQTLANLEDGMLMDDTNTQ
jgi:hypothetical protein